MAEHDGKISRTALLAMVVVGIVAEPIHVFLRGLWVTLKDVFSG